MLSKLAGWRSSGCSVPSTYGSRPEAVDGGGRSNVRCHRPARHGDAEPAAGAFASTRPGRASAESRFVSVFQGKLPGDAGAGAVTAVQAGGFRVVASAGVDLLAARDGVVKCLVLVRCHEDALDTIVLMIGRLATQHDQGIGWATYTGDPATRGGRFNAALEVYCDVESVARVRDAIAASLPSSSLIEESRLQILREVLALP